MTSKYTTLFLDKKAGRWMYVERKRHGFTHVLMGRHLKTLDEAISEACVVHHVPKAAWNGARGDTWVRSS